MKNTSGTSGSRPSKGGAEKKTSSPGTDVALPIRKVALFKHGVGYFERTGAVRGDAKVELYFKALEMNDVLKSLTTLDLNDGLIASISYDSTKPVEKQLEDISLRLGEGNSLTSLLSQAKGARVSAHVGARQITGTVIGIEAVTRREDDVTLTSHRLALLVNGESLQSYDILDISSIVFLDENLRKDLQHLLDTLISAKKKDLKKLTIFTKGKGERQVLASYVVETPVWKTSYRLLLGQGKPLVQGWALVDNTQDEDWENVELTLVAGLPVSFVHDLYSPRYKRRPVVQVQEEEAYAPPMLEAPEEFMADSETDPFRSLAAAAPAMQQERSRDKLRKSKAVASKQDAREGSTPVQTRTVEVGDQFHYEIRNPVTVMRGQSALVPILQTTFDGKRVAVYNPEVREKNPMSAILFRNTTGSMLEGGPMTVLEDEHYVGESMIETLKPDEERIIPFSVELGCVISVDQSRRYTPYHQCRIVNGSLYLHRYTIDKRTYIINNKTDKALDLFLDHRFNNGWDLVDTPNPVERTENFYRFRLEAVAKKTTRFEVNEKYSTSESWEVRDVNRDTIWGWVKSKYIDAATAERIQELAAMNDAVSVLERQVEALQQEIDAIFQNQERLRENLQALGKSESERGLRERYVGEMSAEEDKLRDHRETIRRLKEERKQAEETLRERLKTLTFDQAL